MPTSRRRTQCEPIPTPDRLSPQQAADALGISKQTVLKWIWSGQIPAWRIGKLYKIDRAIVENCAKPTAVSGK